MYISQVFAVTAVTCTEIIIAIPFARSTASPDELSVERRNDGLGLSGGDDEPSRDGGSAVASRALCTKTEQSAE